MRELAKSAGLKEAVGRYIVIYERKCSEKLQPYIVDHDTLKILEINHLKSGAMVLKCEQRNSKRICNINAERFRWKVFTEENVKMVEDYCTNTVYLDQLKECQAQRRLEEAVEQVNRDNEMAHQLASQFSVKEQMQISFVHLVLADLAWQYCDACQAIASNAKIQETKKLNRAINDFKVEYDRFLHRCVDSKHCDTIRKNAKDLSFDEEFQENTQNAYKAIELMYKTRFKTVPYMQLRVVAQLGRMMIKCYMESIDRTNKLMEERLSNFKLKDKSVGNSMIYDTLDSFFDAFQGDYTLEYDSVMKTFVNRWNDLFERAEFVVNEELTIKYVEK